MPVTTRTVRPQDGDTRLDRWFHRHYPMLTQGALQKMLRTGQIRVDGKRAEASTRLLAGQQVRVPPMPAAPAPRAEPKPVDAREAAALERLVLYRDDSVIALDKPQGMPVQGGPGIAKHLDGMLDALRFGAEDRPRLVHRLDRDTTGVLLLARTPAAASRLAAAFRGRDAEKTYWAVVVGRPHPLEGRIDMALGRQRGAGGERTVPSDAKDAARAVTLYRVLDSAQKRAALLELTPLTGRTHQLRVHCAAALGCPILGDGKYGGAAAHPEGFGDRTLHLHARALRIPHPEGGVLELAAPLPPHMKETFAFLGFDRPRTPPCRRVR
ncbi:RluA family pseudouridine synthase [Roseomonas alkaliterrae]|uniref:Pseudouridine synthase n=1 Tax=Neoroseomonas alkaliterrae TaxID=1452450 RepID=A0A840XVW7_9PROT|nr:RluA family pseudouridine synthase [Neoroseomonas alkaliterrae]MBB5690779.1 23S rRNA pseudouridine955/2504/2580 synthase [Neoroseomonas alkaliterrae]MBR0677684.1 RluA family pseudouridine synthase [Neoroseomonas alkaliterrae]